MDLHRLMVLMVLLTHGSLRESIWTFAALGIGHTQCPCVTQTSTVNVPPAVGSDYFCDTGVLWDGNCSDQNIAPSTTLHGSTSSCHIPPLMR
jgi:hypothetical protein